MSERSEEELQALLQARCKPRERGSVSAIGPKLGHQLQHPDWMVPVSGPAPQPDRVAFPRPPKAPGGSDGTAGRGVPLGGMLAGYRLQGAMASEMSKAGCPGRAECRQTVSRAGGVRVKIWHLLQACVSACLVRSSRMLREAGACCCAVYKVNRRLCSSKAL